MEPTDRKEFLDYFPDSIREEVLSPNNQKALSEDFTFEEVKDCIHDVTHHSAPGPDGLPYSFYDVCIEEIGPLLVRVFNQTKDGTPISRARNTSVIKLIYKSGPPSGISNYRPISLMNTEVKIYTHLINKRIAMHIQKIIHKAQTGFVPGRHITDNLDIMDHFYHAYSNLDRGWMVGCLDFRKAFDTISHEWVLSALANVGMPVEMINRVRAVQTHAVSQINIRGVLSRPIPLRTGVRQGCPLSPTLFIIAVDTLVRRLDHQMIGLQSHAEPPPMEPWEIEPEYPEYPTREETYLAERYYPVPNWDLTPSSELSDAKVSAFADDIAVFMGSNHDVVVVGEALAAFNKASGLCLNPDKTILQQVGGKPRPQTDAMDMWAPEARQSNDSCPPTPTVYYSIEPSMAMIREHWKDPKTGKAPSLLDRQASYRYLGIQQGGKAAVAEFYENWKQDLESELRRFSLWGLPYYSQAWLINTFLYSKLVYVIPYVSQIDTNYLDRLGRLACDRINDRKEEDVVNGVSSTRRKFHNDIIQTPLPRGGLGLRNLLKLSEALRANRALRLLTGNTPALRDMTFMFYSESHGDMDTHPSIRLNKKDWFALRDWDRYSSLTFRSCLYALHSFINPFQKKRENPPRPTRTLLPNSEEYFLQLTRELEDAIRFRHLHTTIAMARKENPVCHINDLELEHLRWRSCFLSTRNILNLHEDEDFKRPREWNRIMPTPADDDVWRQIMGRMKHHYHANSRKAQILHFVRISRLGVLRRDFPEATGFKYKQGGCGICRAKLSDGLHEHIFVSCPVVRKMKDQAELPAMEEMKDWIMTELHDKRMGHYLRELAAGIWNIERYLRRVDKDGKEEAVQEECQPLLDKARDAYTAALAKVKYVEEREEVEPGGRRFYGGLGEMN